MKKKKSVAFILLIKDQSVYIVEVLFKIVMGEAQIINISKLKKIKTEEKVFLIETYV